MTIELARARRGSDTQSTTLLKPLIRPPATPSPISARAIVSVIPSRANANSSAPSAAMTISAVCTRRGPYRSRRTPSGNWKRANAPR
jgi:hypothetical protein